MYYICLLMSSKKYCLNPSSLIQIYTFFIDSSHLHLTPASPDWPESLLCKICWLQTQRPAYLPHLLSIRFEELKKLKTASRKLATSELLSSLPKRAIRYLFVTPCNAIA